MVLPESLSVADSDQGNSLGFHELIEVALYVHTDGASTLVKNRVSWSMVDESTHGHSLFLTTTQNIVPVVFFFPTAFSGDEVSEFDIFEELKKSDRLMPFVPASFDFGSLDVFNRFHFFLEAALDVGVV